MTFEVSNPSKQDGTVYINGKWETVLAGTSLITEFPPTDKTDNLTIRRLVTKAGTIQMEPSKAIQKDLTNLDSKSAQTASASKKEEK